MSNKLIEMFRTGARVMRLPIRGSVVSDGQLEDGKLSFCFSEGCAWNRCIFCDRHKKISYRQCSDEEIHDKIASLAATAERIASLRANDGSWSSIEVNKYISTLPENDREQFNKMLEWTRYGSADVMIEDSNFFTFSIDEMEAKLAELKSAFPSITRFECYGRVDSLAKTAVQELERLYDMGLSTIHVGFETGSDQLLRDMQKGCSKEQQVKAAENVKQAGIQLAVYIMPGIGGCTQSDENVRETAELLRITDPHKVHLQSTVVKVDSALDKYMHEGMRVSCTENEKLEEIRQLIIDCEMCSGIFISSHDVNLIRTVTGFPSKDQVRMLSLIDEYFALEQDDQKLYQITRRERLIGEPAEQQQIRRETWEHLKRIVMYTKKEEWEEKMNLKMQSFI